MLDIGLSPRTKPAISMAPDFHECARRRIEKAGRNLIFEIRSSLHGRPSAATAKATAEEALRLAFQALEE